MPRRKAPNSRRPTARTTLPERAAKEKAALIFRPSVPIIFPDFSIECTARQGRARALPLFLQGNHKHFLSTDIGEIRIFSRDEKKQDDMRHDYQLKYPELSGKIKFYIGDVRNPDSLRGVMRGVDYIFHAAALKQVPSCEFFPMEAVRTNVLGTDNVLTAAIDAGVKKVVCLSTDKAAYPINAMGISKAMMEKVIGAKARTVKAEATTICCTRYGNVMASRGSVIPLFIDQIKAGKPITITDPEMTRFLMSLDEAVDLVAFAFGHANPGDLFVQKSPASTIGDLAKAVQKLFGDTGTHIIGTRHGEKLYETLLTREEKTRSEDLGGYYRVAADGRDLNYDKYFVNGEVRTQAPEDYTSHNTRRLTVDEVVDKLLSLEYVKGGAGRAWKIRKKRCSLQGRAVLWEKTLSPSFAMKAGTTCFCSTSTRQKSFWRTTPPGRTLCSIWRA